VDVWARADHHHHHHHHVTNQAIASRPELMAESAVMVRSTSVGSALTSEGNLLGAVLHGNRCWLRHSRLYLIGRVLVLLVSWCRVRQNHVFQNWGMMS
jgi:hypothetical protein